MADLAVVILAYNEAKHIRRALENVAGVAREVFVIDSGSTDGTADIARDAGAVVLQNRFVNYALQYEWALANAPITAEWVMRLDADETLTPELLAEIEQTLPTLPAEITGVNLNRRHIFMGRFIRHGGRYPLTLLRIWRKGCARIEQRWMDEHMVLLRGSAITCVHDFSDHNLNDLTFFTAKHNSYATREAIDVLGRKYGLLDFSDDLDKDATSWQASAKRWIKTAIYNRLPLWAGPLGYFLLRYVFQRGFLDGVEGLVYHVLQGFWYRFLVAAKIEEYDRSLRPLASIDARRVELARLTGYSIDHFTPAKH